ncbi:diphtheria toxin-like protein [Streptomyces sp. SLBN-118]|uniref:eCIS core domain-containing protein n=1 Tax=Streptomyces sp. SLBN-118 TaxID=2768454 RepID=UPI001174A45F|nr:DUF4157 domain-containing protein [Streptomyces sp. SLBN-118]TQK44151.1 diphtheria toxin-like protein [Streptomyces sp. SLBN-118]
MCQQHHEPDRSDELRPKAGEVERADLGTEFPAATVGRSDVIGPMVLLALQRTVGNAAVTQLIQRVREPEVSDQQARQGQQQRSPVLDMVGNGGGQPLDAGIQREMEARMGDDFSDVRIHTGAQADASARAVQAKAYTVGKEIVFRSGAYNPQADAGKHTLAHELTHVQQQRSGPVTGTPTGGGVAISDPADRFEQAAEANASRVMSTPALATPPVPTGSGTAEYEQMVQRCQHPDEEQPIQRCPVEALTAEQPPVQRLTAQRAPVNPQRPVVHTPVQRVDDKTVSFGQGKNISVKVSPEFPGIGIYVGRLPAQRVRENTAIDATNPVYAGVWKNMTAPKGVDPNFEQTVWKSLRKIKGTREGEGFIDFFRQAAPVPKLPGENGKFEFVNERDEPLGINVLIVPSEKKGDSEAVALDQARAEGGLGSASIVYVDTKHLPGFKDDRGENIAYGVEDTLTHELGHGMDNLVGMTPTKETFAVGRGEKIPAIEALAFGREGYILQGGDGAGKDVQSQINAWRTAADNKAAAARSQVPQGSLQGFEATLKARQDLNRSLYQEANLLAGRGMSVRNRYGVPENVVYEMTTSHEDVTQADLNNPDHSTRLKKTALPCQTGSWSHLGGCIPAPPGGKKLSEMDGEKVTKGAQSVADTLKGHGNLQPLVKRTRAEPRTQQYLPPTRQQIDDAISAAQRVHPGVDTAMKHLGSAQALAGFALDVSQGEPLRAAADVTAMLPRIGPGLGNALGLADSIVHDDPEGIAVNAIGLGAFIVAQAIPVIGELADLGFAAYALIETLKSMFAGPTLGPKVDLGGGVTRQPIVPDWWHRPFDWKEIDERARAIFPPPAKGPDAPPRWAQALERMDNQPWQLP